MTYPLGLQLRGRKVLVVGGGPVAARRIPALLDDGALVTVVAPYACEDISERAAAGSLQWLQREYVPADLDGAWLVLSHSGTPAVEDRVAADADAARVWCVKGGDHQASRAWVPAVAKVDDVSVAVNTNGDPKRAAALRDGVAAALDSGELPLRRHRRSPSSEGAVGSVALVGGGPADAGLITTRGRRLLAMADVVVADRLGPRALIPGLGADVEVIEVGKLPGNHPVPQDEINRILVEQALLGNRVVRLKGGDPYVLGRGGEEEAYCRDHGVPVEVVPGVTSAISVPAAAGIPVTHRGVAKGFSVITGHEDITQQAGLIPVGSDHTLVLLMGVSLLPKSVASLISGGRQPSTPVAIIENGWMDSQRVTTGTLETIAGLAAVRGVKSPAVIVVGDVVTLSPHWPTSHLPLSVEINTE
ncbi:uroporphyrin-III C-methyltransferase/precorrin-2 dehydrogenase/sirohydrochlorin ferrochelatase [Arthrobacter pigmenti]|uniref:Uroporphyrin-III C-methyltransferase/precorrin-2 dehydrogenase/sirohydrochlorin ferrochelatase n=1 Tax=Arthrobacter pigmenti TaxID=271432 RepID=A0A846RUJ0_9MICC|nr:uroporphyrinogen-III C-methyltransferase [Arthrobacter pigmenti]NJC23305.1 uroporphyrin-III C-methyltransferase/precorrin-2 dehydrogenase/sirohydrochlorin ferrochelatase [Arthrobacter pigmenti]